MPTGTIAILEDSELRILAMRECMSGLIPTATPLFITDDAFDMLDWLREHLHETSLISLDHDLPIRAPSHPVDNGDGRMIADYLATLPPTCPVIVHSSNDICASGMYYALQHAGWPVSRMVPYEGDSWICDAWAEQIRKYITTGWLRF